MSLPPPDHIRDNAALLVALAAIAFAIIRISYA